MEKRDRQIELLFHRRSRTLLLFPYLCVMAGNAVACGDACSVMIDDEDAPTQVGTMIRSMLAYCRTIDVEPLAQKRSEALRSRWRGEDVGDSELMPQINETSNWCDIQSPFPSLTKGPGIYLRAFSQARLIERTSWKSYKLEAMVKSRYPGSLSGGRSVRVRTSISSTTLGEEVIQFTLSS